MKTKSIILTVVMSLFIAVGMNSCSTKRQAINQLETLSEDLRDNSSHYSVKQWQKAVERFIKVREKISKHELEYTADEKARIGQLEGRCAAYMSKGLKDGIFDKLDGFKRELQGILRGFFQGIIDDKLFKTDMEDM